MKILHLLTFFLVTLWIFHPQTASSEPRYIADEFTVTIRRGAGNDFKIVKLLPTGAKVETTSQPGGDWTQVRTEDGAEGWILTRFLSREIPARLRVESAVAAQKKAEEERDHIKEEIAKLHARLADFDKLKTEMAHLSQISANPVALDNANKNLKARLSQLGEEIQHLQKENMQLNNQANTNYFLAGAGVLFLGFLGGLVLSRPKRRDNNQLGF